ncbi:glycosyltransferase family 4 protein [Candidatus Bathyarchaeota archaeon]|nr:glycosyltransferase family 4 protein [Candidatus Bathyarchaeota archaeon]
MKVLMITPGFSPIRGGTETIVKDLSIELNRIGVNTDVMTFNMDKKWNPKWQGTIQKIDDITVFKIPALNLIPIEHPKRLISEINLIPGRFTHLMKNYDVIHFHEQEFSFPLFSYFKRKPKLFHLHGIDYEYFRRYHLSRCILKNVTDYYVCITKKIEKEVAKLGIEKNRILYLPNSINVDLFQPGKKEDENLILFVGRIAPIKGLHILIKALRYLKSPVNLVIVGPINDFEYYQKIVRYIEKENQRGEHRITYSGCMPPADPSLIRLYQKASIFVLPSFFEGFPVVLLEALACETPVISTPVGGIPEIIHDFKNGFLVPTGNPIKLADTIQYLLENKSLRAKLGQTGREDVEKNYSVSVVTRKLCHIYEQLINK